MSCFSANNNGEFDRDSLLAEKLRQFTNKFTNVLYPAIIDVNGEMISIESSSQEFPPDYAEYVYTMKALAEKILKIFCSSNVSKLKVRSEKQAFFSLYCLDQFHVLVFFSEIDPDISKAADPTSSDEKFHDILNEMKNIVSSAVEIV